MDTDLKVKLYRDNDGMVDVASGERIPEQLIPDHFVAAEDYGQLQVTNEANHMASQQLREELADLTASMVELEEECTRLQTHRTYWKDRAIVAIGEAIDASLQRDKLQRFKDYVHRYLDDAGVPSEPNKEQNQRTGCRIEGRLDWLVEKANKP